MRSTLTVVDFYSGAGLGSLGFKLAGFNLLKAYDNNEWAVKTYNNNLGSHAEVVDVRKLKPENVPDADIHISTPVCKSFSFGGSGAGEKAAKTGDLAVVWTKLLLEKKPKAFLFENVAGLVSKKHINFFNELLELWETEYIVTWKLVDFVNYAVPQNRKRVIAVGVRKDLNKTYKFPEEFSITNTLKRALKGLPHMPDKSLNHSEFYNKGMSSRYKSRNRQRQWDEPSFTIVSEARQLPMYPEPANYDIRNPPEGVEPPRRFTPRECLRIQTVPDWFRFPEDMPLNKQYERCSGIPSIGAYYLATPLRDLLEDS